MKFIFSNSGRWNADPKSSSLVIEPPDALVVAENGPEVPFGVRLKDPIEEGDQVKVTLELAQEDRRWVDHLFPTEFTFDSRDWSQEKWASIKPRDNSNFDGDVKYYIKLVAVHADSNKGSFTREYPVIQQDDEHMAGDTLFDPIEVAGLPFGFMGDTSPGYTNTMQSRCELGSSSADVVSIFLFLAAAAQQPHRLS